MLGSVGDPLAQFIWTCEHKLSHLEETTQQRGEAISYSIPYKPWDQFVRGDNNQP